MKTYLPANMFFFQIISSLPSEKKREVFFMKKMVLAAMLAAIGVLTSNLIYVPVGIAKCFPMQHMIGSIG